MVPGLVKLILCDFNKKFSDLVISTSTSLDLGAVLHYSLQGQTTPTEL